MEPVSCPFCNSRDCERVGLWGGQLIVAQWRCNRCASYFEAVRDEGAVTNFLYSEVTYDTSQPGSE
jgi:hypothetical protein